MTPRFGVGLDIGGTKVLGAVVDDAGQVLSEHRVPSPTGSWSGMLAAIVEVADELRDRHPNVETVGIGAAGMVDLDGTIHFAPNVPAFRTTTVRADVEAAVGLPTVVDNDANVAAYAEVRFGAARGVHDALVITFGTGIGGGVVIGGQRAAGCARVRRRDRALPDRPRWPDLRVRRAWSLGGHGLRQRIGRDGS